MIKNSNYHHLKQIADDLTVIQTGNKGIAYLFQRRIKDFFQQNDANLIRMGKKLNQLIDAHVEKDEKEEPKVDEKGNFIFTSEEAMKTYSEEYDKFFNQNIDIL